jgi:hypothetical protein
MWPQIARIDELSCRESSKPDAHDLPTGSFMAALAPSFK